MQWLCDKCAAPITIGGAHQLPPSRIICCECFPSFTQHFVRQRLASVSSAYTYAPLDDEPYSAYSHGYSTLNYSLAAYPSDDSHLATLDASAISRAATSIPMPSPSAAQRLFSLTAEEYAFSPNEAMQRTYDLPAVTPQQLRERDEQIREVFMRARNASVNIGKYLVTMVASLPVDEWTWPPLDAGAAGGIKFLVSNYIIKIAVSRGKARHIYGASADSITKAMRCEQQGFQAIVDAHVEGLHVPPMAVLQYKGYRALVSALLPVDHTTLKVGSGDGGRTIAADSDALIEGFAELAKKLHLKPHQTIDGTGEHHLTHLAGDVEGHVGHDGRLYILDAGRVLPPQQAASDTIPFPLMHHFRREFMLNHMPCAGVASLCSDTFLRWGRHDAAAHVADIRKVFRFFVSEHLARVAADLLDDTPDELSPFLHERGVNIRFILLLRSHVLTTAHANAPRVAEHLLREALVRSVKVALRREQRRATADYARVVADFLTRIGQLPSLWRGQLHDAAAVKFVHFINVQHHLADLAPAVRDRFVADTNSLQDDFARLHKSFAATPEFDAHLLRCMRDLAKDEAGDWSVQCHIRALRPPRHATVERSAAMIINELRLRKQLLSEDAPEIAELRAGLLRVYSNWVEESPKISRELGGVVAQDLLHQLRTHFAHDSTTWVPCASAISQYYRRAGEYHTSVDVYRESLAVVESDDSADLDTILNARNALAVGLLRIETDIDQAIELGVHNLELVEASDDDELKRGWLGVSHQLLGNAYRLQARYADASAHHVKALEFKVKVYGEDSSKVAVGLNNAAINHITLGRYHDALEMMHRALEIYAKNANEMSLPMGIAYGNMALALLELGCLDQLLEISNKSICSFSGILEDGHVSLAIAWSHHGSALLLLGQAQEALDVLQRAHAVLERNFGRRHRRMLLNRVRLAAAKRQLGLTDDALKEIQTVLADMDECLVPEHEYAAMAKTEHAHIAQAAGEEWWNQALELYDEAARCWSQIGGTDQHPNAARARLHRGKLLVRMGRQDEGRELVREAKVVLEGALDGQHPDLQL